MDLKLNLTYEQLEYLVKQLPRKLQLKLFKSLETEFWVEPEEATSGDLSMEDIVQEVKKVRQELSAN